MYSLMRKGVKCEVDEIVPSPGRLTPWNRLATVKIGRYSVMLPHPTTIEVPPELAAEIDRLVFVESPRRELKREKLLKALEDPEPVWRDEDHPELADGADAWVRAMRAEGEERFQKLQRETL